MTEFPRHADLPSSETLVNIIDMREHVLRMRNKDSDHSRPMSRRASDAAVLRTFSQYDDHIAKMRAANEAVRVEVDSSMQNTDIHETDTLELETDEH